MEGPLDKWSRKIKEFRPCYVVVSPKHKSLLYYDDDTASVNAPRGKFDLSKAVINVDESESTTFSIVDNNRYLRFRAPDIPKRNLWVSKISELSSLTSNYAEIKEFKQSKDCIEFMMDEHNKLSTSVQSLNINDLELTGHLNKFLNQLIEIKTNIDEFQYLTDSEHNISEIEEDTESKDMFFECEIPGAIIETDQTVISSKIPGNFDDESSPEEDEIEVKSSIIAHLVSQVRIGMDLTKITLPTYILERRSLLEMFGDFFSRPQILLSAISKDHPRDRFITVVQHYLGSFYPGRRIKVAKKPYNPILGEYFKCFYQCMPNRSEYPDNDKGPVQWAKTCDLSFIGEQVSHHPPISAFYAECPSAKFSCNAFIYTKSKFLGASVAVENIGKGVISLHQFDEDYEFNFPSGYARSIFTVPWFELGGSCYLICKKTGYSAHIDFLTKPFMRGKKNKISVEIYDQNVKKPIAIIHGEWNGHMLIKYHEEDDDRIFIDSLHEPIHRKYVRALSNQETNESRVIWQNVTKALKQKDVDAATLEKTKVEERQRDLAKSRSGIWQPTYFERTAEEEFVYRSQLKHRL